MDTIGKVDVIEELKAASKFYNQESEFLNEDMFFSALARACNKLTDAQFNKLSDGAIQWVNAAITLIKSGLEVTMENIEGIKAAPKTGGVRASWVNEIQPDTLGEPCCGKCFFYRDKECHKLPPVRLPRKFEPEATSGNRVRDETLLWGWPTVNYHDWCGEFKPTKI